MVTQNNPAIKLDLTNNALNSFHCISFIATGAKKRQKPKRIKLLVSHIALNGISMYKGIMNTEIKENFSSSCDLFQSVRHSAHCLPTE